jgi:hypothetical protein
MKFKTSNGKSDKLPAKTVRKMFVRKVKVRRGAAIAPFVRMLEDSGEVSRRKF